MSDSSAQRAAAVLLMLLSEEDRPKKARTTWVKKLGMRRESHGAHHHLIDDIIEDPFEYRRYLRMTPDSFEELLRMVKHHIQKEDTNMRESIQPEERLDLTLRFLATGESMRSLHYQYRMGVSTVHSIVYETCSALIKILGQKYIKLPSTAEQWLDVASKFNSTCYYPHCLGAIDGKHITIYCPRNSGSYYYNYKRQFSIILLAVVDADGKALYVNAGTNGRVHDSAVFKRTPFHQKMVNGELILPPNEPLPGEGQTGM
ncbi:uncharacterized protein LOC135389631 [Ornithodoros turicata]|uniref:uncharacterized protein LOC135389631 n=1 Tax=Ornithodoros turicata TaxID=34597 RepID=UPI0031395AD9